MDIWSTIRLDFIDNTYKCINAKQGDSLSRYIEIICEDNRKPVILNTNTHSAFVRFKKPDGYSIVHQCDILSNGHITFELTAQMLVTPGIADLDIVIYNSTAPRLDSQGKLIDENAVILSTMKFSVKIFPQAVDYSNVVSSNEFEMDDINQLLSDLTEAKYIVSEIDNIHKEMLESLEQIQSGSFYINFDDGHMYFGNT